jgi:hypothetical protein
MRLEQSSRRVGRAVEAFVPNVTRENFRDAFAAAARSRGDVAGTLPP